MKTKFLHLALGCLLIGLCGLAHAQGTAITYQGVLSTNGAPANGTNDFTFSLFGVASGGSALAGPLTNLNVRVTNGLFTVALDFGSLGDTFYASDRWLEIATRPAGAGAFVSLTPRQPITPTPRALYASYAGSAAGAATLNGPLPSVSLAGNYPQTVSITNPANQFRGSFTGNGGGLTNVVAQGLSAAGAAAFWQLNGNTGNTQGVHFIGTTDERETELRANNTTALRLSRINTTAIPNLIGGFGGNSVAGGSQGAVIGGGGAPGATNRILSGNVATLSGGSGNTVSGEAGVIAGGNWNSVSGQYSTVSGGQSNSASFGSAVIAGGDHNTVANDRATVSGGYSNQATARLSAVGGGNINLASGEAATVPGGSLNWASGYASTAMGFSTTASGYYSTAMGNSTTASGWYSTAMGRRARALHDGCFVWADSLGGYFDSTGNNQFLLRASGGVGINTTNPASSLEVNGGIRARGGAPGGSGANNNGYAFSGNGGDNDSGMFSSADGQLEFYNNAQERVRITSLGNFGIGTTTPQHRLDILGNAAVRGSLMVNYDNTQDSSYPELPGLLFGNYDSGELISSQRGTNGANKFGLDFYTGFGRRMVIANNGRVGIGINAPDTLLHVKDTAQDVVTLESSATGGTWTSLRNTSAGGKDWRTISTGSGNGEGAGKLLFFVDGARRFEFRANGDFITTGTVNPPSDRNVKRDFAPADAQSVLEKVARLPIQTWAYTNDATIRHIGPVAQDFHAAFGLGTDDKHIATVDADGVALAAIQGLNEKVESRSQKLAAENAALRRHNEALEQRLQKLEALLSPRLSSSR